ncbi:hypothetical protein DFH09DRAFT_374917 [Mycena vulgaris]|nr:hypothetical protein DFH09DRAFT_374917 [Mycena vulgaris]
MRAWDERTETSPTTVYVAASGKDSGKQYDKAGFGVYWGVANARNASYRMGEGSESRADLMAILYAILAVPEDRSSVIYSSSQYVIRSYCYWEGSSLDPAPHGPNQLRFYLNKPELNAHAIGARTMARDAVHIQEHRPGSLLSRTQGPKWSLRASSVYPRFS